MMIKITDRFNGLQRHPHWNRLTIGSAWVEESYGLRLIMRNGPAGSLCSAQLDDFVSRPREEFPWTPPVVLKLRARVNLPAGDLLGTAGFGFWNNMAPLWSRRMEVLPNWIWFYYASPETTVSPTKGPASGWKASVVHGGLGGENAMAFNDFLLRIPLIGKKLGRVRMPTQEKDLSAWDFSIWHDFEIHWHREVIHFRIDGEEVLEAHLRVDMPLAFYAWVDNNYAGVKENGEMDLGYLGIPGEQVLMIDNLEINPGRTTLP
jgi:hypothetical protein